MNIRPEDIQFGGPYYQPMAGPPTEEEGDFEPELFVEDPYVSEHYGELTPYGITGKPENFPTIRGRERLFGGTQEGMGTGFMPERETSGRGGGINYARLGGTALTTGVNVLKSVAGGGGVGDVLSGLNYGPVLSNLLNLLGGEDNAAGNYMAGNLGNLATQYFSSMASQGAGLFSDVAQAATTGMGAIQAGATGLTGAVNPLGAMMAGQGLLNTYGSYLSVIPFVGDILGGLLTGVTGGDKFDPTISGAWLASLQRKEMDPRWGSQGDWDWRLKGGPGAPISEADKDLTFKRPTNPKDLQWYMRDYAPYAAQLWSPYGQIRQMSASGPMDYPEEFQADPNSPLGKWWNILEKRDKASGVKNSMDLYGKYYTSYGDRLSSQASQGRVKYQGVNPFKDLTNEQVQFFYDEVLPYIDKMYSKGGWYGHEGLLSESQPNEPLGSPEPAISRRLI